MLLNNCDQQSVYVLPNIKHAYLCHSATKINPIRLRLAKKSNEHTRIRPRERHLAHALRVERSQLGGGIRGHVVHLRGIQAGLASLARQYRPAPISAGGVPTNVCAS
jgi:hypothetical protein